MAAPGGKSFFVGPQKLATVDDLDAFVRRAGPEESFVWCEALEQIASLTKARVTELIADGLVRNHALKRAGGGYEFTVFRTGKRLAAKGDPVTAALSDPATDVIFRALKRAANLGLPCPTDTDLMRTAGLAIRQSAQQRVRKLIELKLIQSTVAYEGGVRTRVVTIAAGPCAGSAGGKTTRLPPRWAAMAKAAQREIAR
jgi:hypothetical protein